jgi:hypothetical protein
MTRFTLRDVFWLTLVVGMGVGWWMDHRALAPRVKAAELWRGRAEGIRDAWEKAGGVALWISDDSPNILLTQPEPVGQP